MAQAIAHQLVVCDSKIRLQVVETKDSDRSLELLQAGKVELASIPVNNSVSASVKLVSYLFNDSAILPKGIYQGNTATPPQDLATISVRRILIANSRASTEAIYELTKTIYENCQVLINKMALANEIAPPNSHGGSLIPIHSGAANYYNRAEPDFFSKNSDLIGLLVTITLAALSWVWQLKEQFARVQKNRSDLYNTELIQMMDDIKNCEDLDSLDKIREILYQKFAIAIDAFARDRIAFESLQSIRFTWDATMSAVKDLEAYLLR